MIEYAAPVVGEDLADPGPPSGVSEFSGPPCRPNWSGGERTSNVWMCASAAGIRRVQLGCA
jgi:hypothetical protein